MRLAYRDRSIRASVTVGSRVFVGFVARRAFPDGKFNAAPEVVDAHIILRDALSPAPVICLGCGVETANPSS
jgi:hypothetical protein